MTLQRQDRVWETTTTTGTVSYTLSGAVVGYRTFGSVCSNSDTAEYVATDGTNWEVGLGTYATAGNTLARSSIYASSNSNSPVSWSAGTKNIWIDIPAHFFQSSTGSGGLVYNTSPSIATATLTGPTISGASISTTTLATSTLTSPSISAPLLTGTVNISSLTASRIVLTDGSSNLTTSLTLPNGTLATTQSSGDNSTKLATTAYVDTKPGSGMTFLATVNASASASVVFTSSSITNTYNKYVIEFDGVYGSGASPEFDMLVSSNNGGSYSNSGYATFGYKIASDGTYTAKTTSSQSKMQLSFGDVTTNGAAGAMHGTIKFSNPSNGGTSPVNFIYDFSVNNNAFYHGVGVDGAIAINNIKIFDNAGGNINGNFHLYGLQGT